MKVLILTVLAGGGHYSAGRSVKAKLEELNPNIETKTIDILKEYDEADFQITSKGYATIIGKAPLIYSAGYHLSRTKVLKDFSALVPESVSLRVIPAIYKEINQWQPDVIYCTHFYAGIAMSLIREKFKIPAKVILSSLDYDIEPFMDHALNVDYLTIANEVFIPGRMQTGYKLSQLKATGIPTLEQFYHPLDKAEARKKLGLREDLYTVMVMFGGGEWSGAPKIYKDLISTYKEELQVIVINGNSKKSFNQIKHMRAPKNIHLLNVGFTSEVEVYMSASDICLTKAGGLSTTEMVNLGLPMLISSHVYGQENANRRFMVYHGVALSFKNASDLGEKIKLAKELGPFFNGNFEKIRKHGAENIAKLIIEQGKADYDEDYIASIDYASLTKQISLFHQSGFRYFFPINN